jgi:L-amino acid N-acyltransferase
MKVRPADKSDLPAILEIYNDAVLTTTASYDYEPHTLEQREHWLALRRRQGLPIFVAEDPAGRVMGWSALNRYHDRVGYRFTVENSVYVAAGDRGQGVGRALLGPLVDSARSLGLRAIIAAIDASNEASLRLHARFGFFKVGHFRQVGFKFGRWLDVVYLECLVSADPVASPQEGPHPSVP